MLTYFVALTFSSVHSGAGFVVAAVGVVAGFGFAVVTAFVVVVVVSALFVSCGFVVVTTVIAVV